MATEEPKKLCPLGVHIELTWAAGTGQRSTLGVAGKPGQLGRAQAVKFLSLQAWVHGREEKASESGHFL